MSFPFNPLRGLIMVRTELAGPSGRTSARLALDTGASRTLINTGVLVTIGYDPVAAAERVQVTTGSSVEFVPRVPIRELTALGQERTDLLVLCHTLPPTTGIDGLLGLDFLRGTTLTLDFQRGEIVLSR